MKLNNISFPYPVLGVNDDISPGLPDDAIVVSCDRSNVKEYKLSVSLRFNNPYINNLIDQGYATYVCEVDCEKTNLRYPVVCNGPDFTFNINRRIVSGNVTLSCYVTVIKPITDYRNPGAHEDYEDASFNLTPGDILVGFSERSFPADPKFDKLQSVTSFMQIRHDTENNYTNFDMSGRTIDIKLPTELFKIYKSGVGNSYAEVIHSSIAQTALVSALYEINTYRDKIWAQAIEQLIKNNPELNDYYTDDEDGFHFTDHLHIATILLKDPFNRMLHRLKESIPNDSIFNV